MAGMSVGLVYLYYYSSSDTWLFFNDASKLSAFARENFTAYVKILFDFNYKQNLPGLISGDFRALIFIKILSLFCFVSGDMYWVCVGYFSLLSFCAAWYLHEMIIQSFQNSSAASALAFLFFPSVVFWGSGLVKETLTLASLYFLSGVFLQFVFNKKIDVLTWLLTVIATTVLWALKYYWAGVFFIAAAALLTVLFFTKRIPGVEKYSALAYLFFFATIGIVVSFLHPNFYLHRFLEVLFSNHEAFVRLSNDNNLIHFYQPGATVMSVVINSPWALFSGFFRPMVGEGQGLLGFIASMENLLILILFISFLWNFKKRLPITILFVAVLSYCVVLCVFLALSTPNLGTLSRYRVGFLPFLIFVFSYKNSLIEYFTRKYFTQRR